MVMTASSAVARVRDGGWKTYSAISPPQLHWRYVTCAAFDCPKLRAGWDVRIDESMKLGEICADYIRHVTNRRGWTETKDPSGVTVFTFPAGTPCFQDARDRRAQQTFSVPSHRKRVVGAPTLYVVGDGPAARVQEQLNTTGRPASILRAHSRGADWIEDLAESWNKMADAVNN